jgi:hypothetical protein
MPLSHALFRPDGRFNQLARTAEELRLIARSPLFQKAQRRTTELRRSEAEPFAPAVQRAQAAIPDGDYWLPLEQPEGA